MAFQKLILFLILTILFGANAKAQRKYTIHDYEHSRDSIIQLITKDTSSFLPVIPGVFAYIDKVPGKYRRFLFFNTEATTFKTSVQTTELKEPVIKVHGNIYYDYYYRSNVDTPYIFKDYQQHTIRTYLDVTIRNNYPIRIAFTTRINNASFLKNMAGINFQFNSSQFAQSIKDRLLNWLNNKQEQSKKIQLLDEQIKNKLREIDSLKFNLDKSSVTQKLVEEKEKAWLAMNMPVSKKDSLMSGVTEINTITLTIDSTEALQKNSYETAKRKYDSLNKQLVILQEKYSALVNQSNSSYLQSLQNIKNGHSSAQIIKEIADSNIPDSLLPAGYKKLLAIKSFGIGRTVINYSELSAKNITINGVQLEYNPSTYFAFAAGVIDYRYRDLLMDNHEQQKQYLTMFRVGKGLKDGNSIIFSVFQGKKQLYNYVTSNNDSIHYPDYSLMGFTIEGNYRVGKTTLITGELAKSAAPYYNRMLQGRSMLKSNLSFSDHSNEAYSFKANTYIPKTDTKFYASYKKLGSNFQSFSLFNTSSRQVLWSVKMEQSFFKRKLSVTGSIQTNDFSNPYIDNNYYSNTIFKSIQATMRLKKLPIVSVGYFPSSQLVKLSERRYMENLFYTMTGYISHFYHLHDSKMNTFLSYTRFYNRQADSGFVYFNTKNILLNHTVYFSKLTLAGGVSIAANNTYKLYTTNGDIQMPISKNVIIKGGIKYSHQTVFDKTDIGYNIGSTIKISKLGEFQLFAEKGFIPGISRQLISNNTGRFSYYKVF